MTVSTVWRVVSETGKISEREIGVACGGAISRKTPKRRTGERAARGHLSAVTGFLLGFSHRRTPVPSVPTVSVVPMVWNLSFYRVFTRVTSTFAQLVGLDAIFYLPSFAEFDYPTD